MTFVRIIRDVHKESSVKGGLSLYRVETDHPLVNVLEPDD